MKRIIILSCFILTLLFLPYANGTEPNKDEPEQPKEKNQVIEEIIDIEDPVMPKFVSNKRNSPFEQRYDRQKAIKQDGGSDMTEYGALLAMRWLKKHQNPDGSWGEDPYKPSMTGLVLLAFLGHGEDHLSEEFGSTVRGAADFLVSYRDKADYFAKEQRALQHAIATYALAEMYAMTKLEDLLPIVDKATKIIIAAQTKDGGWNYDYAAEENNEKSNILPITGWQIQALKAAQTAGIKFADGSLEKAMALGTEYTQEKYNPETMVFGDKDKAGTWEDNLCHNSGRRALYAASWHVQ
jgi:hypothetical protein